MKCKSGIFVGTVGHRVPCGQCMPCRINKGRLWTSRIMMESVTHGQMGWFLTLTYDPEHVPIAYDHENQEAIETLDKSEFKKWIKASQRSLGSYRYYAVGEYGEVTGRPHYHMAVFPQSYAQVLALCDMWEEGFHTLSEMCDERARYLANYTAKKLTKADDQRLALCQEPEFRCSSGRPPLGADFADRIIEHYKQPKFAAIVEERGDIERSWRLGGRTYPIGQYPLTRIRKGLGIPLLHRERARANPRYLDYHETEETECNPEEAKGMEVRIRGKKTQRLHRSTSIKL